MKVHNIIQSIQSNIVYKKELNNRVKSDNSVPNDTVSISSKARDLQKANQVSQKSDAGETQNVGQDRLSEVRKRIEDGYYSSPNVLSDIADKLLKYFNL